MWSEAENREDLRLVLPDARGPGRSNAADAEAVREGEADASRDEGGEEAEEEEEQEGRDAGAAAADEGRPLRKAPVEADTAKECDLEVEGLRAEDPRGAMRGGVEDRLESV